MINSQNYSIYKFVEQRDEVKIASVDGINMYSPIKLSTIIKAVRLFARKVTSATKKTINRCLELVRSGMSSTPMASTTSIVADKEKNKG